MPEISAGHSIAKAFLPHQRVTTEGKKMGSKEELEKQIEALLHLFDPEEFSEENSGNRAKVLAEYLAKNIVN